MATIEKALTIAAEAHAGQRDKDGQPYILHPLRVMGSVEGDAAKMVAILHDVIEDTAVTREDLICITGSFYLVGEAKRLFASKAANPTA